MHFSVVSEHESPAAQSESCLHAAPARPFLAHFPGQAAPTWQSVSLPLHSASSSQSPPISTVPSMAAVHSAGSPERLQPTFSIAARQAFTWVPSYTTFFCSMACFRRGSSSPSAVA